MSEVDGYTPSTEEVRNNVAFGVAAARAIPERAVDIDWPIQGLREGAKAQFDAWLLAERARIWDEGAEAGGANSNAWNGWRYRDGYPLVNPYRKGGDA